jgi:hypothetical protein
MAKREKDCKRQGHKQRAAHATHVTHISSILSSYGGRGKLLASRARSDAPRYIDAAQSKGQKTEAFPLQKRTAQVSRLWEATVY